jgi:signal transduction histidine kinase
MEGSRSPESGGTSIARRASLTGYAPFLAATAIGSVVTLVTLLSPAVHFAYQNPPLHVAFETGEALIASIVGLVLFGRYRETHLLRDLLLVYALVLLALTNVVFSVIPTVVLQDRPDITFAWAPAGIRLFAAGVLVASAFLVGERRERIRRPALAITAVAALTLQIVGGFVIALRSRLPEPLGDFVLPSESSEAFFQGHPVFMVMQATIMVLFGLAGYGFGRHAAMDKDESMHWIAAACVLGAFARLHYMLFPSLYTDYVYTGDLLRLAFYVLLLVGGVREIQSFWEGRTASAVAQERQRFARDLHDGAAQELLFILAQTRRMLRGKGDREDLESLASAADRAVYESRRAINALSSGTTQTLDEAVKEAAIELGKRWGGDVETSLEIVSVSPEITEHVVRVTREAMTNAVKHASPTSIKVTLDASGTAGGPESIVVIVEDDGAGFDLEGARSSKRFGLTSMEERMQVLGGNITFTSRPGAGTTVRVEVPVPVPEDV